MTQWHVTGTVLIACNCDWGCPCNFNAMPTQGFCEGGWAWQIEQGQYDGVDLAGLAVSLYAKWPGAIHHGGGTAVCYLDSGADERQRAALTRLLRGEAGGPWAIFSGTYTLEGPHRATHRMEPAEQRSRLEVGDAVRLELTPLTNPVTGIELHPEIVLPEGLVVKRAALATSNRFEVSGGTIAYDYSGKYTAVGRFDYVGEVPA